MLIKLKRPSVMKPRQRDNALNSPPLQSRCKTGRTWQIVRNLSFDTKQICVYKLRPSTNNKYQIRHATRVAPFIRVHYNKPKDEDLKMAEQEK
ncbi:MAG: hypothetical protein KGZ80_03255, partial [Methylomonas sp.]|nr:hypothetical protein [Methylomonas sp.]